MTAFDFEKKKKTVDTRELELPKSANKEILNYLILYAPRSFRLCSLVRADDERPLGQVGVLAAEISLPECPARCQEGGSGSFKFENTNKLTERFSIADVDIEGV